VSRLTASARAKEESLRRAAEQSAREAAERALLRRLDLEDKAAKVAEAARCDAATRARLESRLALDARRAEGQLLAKAAAGAARRDANLAAATQRRRLLAALEELKRAPAGKWASAVRAVEGEGSSSSGIDLDALLGKNT